MEKRLLVHKEIRVHPNASPISSDLIHPRILDLIKTYDWNLDWLWSYRNYIWFTTKDNLQHRIMIDDN